MADPVLFYDSPHEFLSGYYPARFRLRGVDWPTVEHYYQAQKFPEHEWERVLSAPSARDAEQIGAAARGPWMHHWEDRRVLVMAEATSAKFEQNRPLRRLLAATEAATN